MVGNLSWLEVWDIKMMRQKSPWQLRLCQGKEVVERPPFYKRLNQILISDQFSTVCFFIEPNCITLHLSLGKEKESRFKVQFKRN